MTFVSCSVDVRYVNPLFEVFDGGDFILSSYRDVEDDLTTMQIFFQDPADAPRAAEALAEMKRQQPEDIFEDGLIKKGMIIRHLVLPGCTDDSLDVLDKIKSMFGRHQLVSVMRQYTPLGKNLPDELYRPLSRDEYEKVTSYAMLIGLVNGYFQEGDAVGESFIPDF